MVENSHLLFDILRSVFHNHKMDNDDKSLVSGDSLKEVMKLASKHDIAHLVSIGVLNNGLVDDEIKPQFQQMIFKAIYRYEKINCEFNRICSALEKAQIPFIPLKGSVLRKFYPKPWMRTSCDIDILVHAEDLERAVLCAEEKLQYKELGRSTHDIPMVAPSGLHVEIHFDLVEEKRANKANLVLSSVWDNVTLSKDSKYQYEMSDEFFYFYHLTHMAKHFETGGCGIRPFIDLWILDRIPANKDKRDQLLLQGNLLKFATNSRNLNQVWFEGKEADELSLRMQEFIFSGGVYGTSENRVAIHQNKNGGRFRYIMSRVFASKDKLKRYYPILEKYPILLPVMQVRRWFMLLSPHVAKMAKNEIAASTNLDKAKSKEMNVFLNDLGLE